MSDIEMWREHLVLADRDIAEAKQRVDKLRRHLGATGAIDSDKSQWQESLDLAREALVTMEEHRELILQSIANIEAGKP